MSELTVWMRGHGLGGVLNAIEGVEGAVAGAVQSNPQVQTEVQNVETQTVDEVGSAAQGVVVGAITKVNPQAGVIAKDVSNAFLPALEAFVLHFFQQGTVAAETKPAPEPPPAA